MATSWVLTHMAIGALRKAIVFSKVLFLSIVTIWCEKSEAMRAPTLMADIEKKRE